MNKNIIASEETMSFALQHAQYVLNISSLESAVRSKHNGKEMQRLGAEIYG